MTMHMAFQALAWRLQKITIATIILVGPSIYRKIGAVHIPSAPHLQVASATLRSTPSRNEIDSKAVTPLSAQDLLEAFLRAPSSLFRREVMVLSVARRPTPTSGTSVAVTRQSQQVTKRA